MFPQQIIKERERTEGQPDQNTTQGPQNRNEINLTSSMYLGGRGKMSEEFTQLFQNRLGDGVQSCIIQNNSKLTNKNIVGALISYIQNRAIMILYDWLRTVKSDSSTEFFCSCTLDAWDMLKRKEKIRYVF